MKKFKEWLEKRKFNKEHDVLVLGTDIGLKGYKIIYIKSFTGIAIIK